MHQLIKDIFGIKSKNRIEVKEVFPLPVKSIGDILLGTDGKYKMVGKVSPVNAELMNEEDISSIFDAIQGALGSYNGRFQIVIQSERVDIEKNVENIEKRKQELSSELNIELLEEQAKHLQGMSSKSRNVLNFYIVIETKEKDYVIAEQVLDDSFGAIKTELESQEMYVDRLSKTDLMQLLYERMNPDSSQYEPLQDSWELTNIIPENSRRLKDGKTLEIENYYFRHFSITKYPQTVDKYRWLRKLFSFKGNINVSITLTPKNKATINEELSKAISELNAKEREHQGKDEAKRQEFEAQAQSAKEMIQELGSDNVNLYDTNITIGIYAKDEKELNSLVNSLRAKVSSTYCQLTEIKRKDFDPFFITLPILVENRITKYYVWNLSSKDIASLIIFDSSELMESKGILIGENVTSGGLVIVDPYNRIYNNPHLCIIADSGSGKSFWIACNIIRDKPYMDFIIQFDVDGTAKFPWSTKYHFNPTSNVITNPFHIRNATLSKEHEEGKVDVGSFLAVKIMDLITFFKWILPSMTEYDEALLEEDIRDTYQKVGLSFESTSLPEKFPTLSTLAEVMQSKIDSNNSDNTEKAKESRTNMKASLNPYIRGAYSKMFNGQTNWDYKAHTIFDISQLPEAVQKPMYEILLKDTWQFVKKDGTLDKMPVPIKKKVVIDECHTFADEKKPQTLKFISTELIKQSRKFGVNVVTATQNIADLTSIKKYGQAIIDNSFFKIFFRLGENDHELAKKLYGFSESEMKVIKGSGSRKSGSKGKGIFMAGSQRVLFQSRASKYELEIIDPAQYEEIYKEKSRFI